MRKNDPLLRMVTMEALPDEELPEYLCLWDGDEEEDRSNLTGYFLYRVCGNGLIYMEED
jgi:hypothetical protein